MKHSISIVAKLSQRLLPTCLFNPRQVALIHELSKTNPANTKFSQIAFWTATLRTDIHFLNFKFKFLFYYIRCFSHNFINNLRNNKQSLKAFAFNQVFQIFVSCYLFLVSFLSTYNYRSNCLKLHLCHFHFLFIERKIN